MKITIRHSFFLLFVSTLMLIVTTSASFAESEEAGEPLACPISDDLENHSLAAHLLRMAEENEDAWLAITAARLLNEVPGGTLLSPEIGDAKATKDAFSKLDASSAKSVARRSLDSALELATKLADGDEHLLAEISKIGSAEAKWYSYTCYTYNNLGAWFYWTAPARSTARRNAMSACQSYTPWGYRCYHSHCD